LKTAIAAILLLISFGAKAQVNGSVNTNGSSSNAITTAVPFLTITPDARSGALGEAGVAISPDVNASYWNPSKLAFIENTTNVSLSYTPWLQKILPNSYIAYGSFASKLDDRNTFGASVRYFNLGTADLYDNDQNATGFVHPNEVSVDASLARKFGEDFSLGLTLRYIYSDLTSGLIEQGQTTNPGKSLAADVSLYYKKETQQFDKDALFAFGVNVSNIGTKINYERYGEGYFLPTNLKIGIANTWYLDDDNTLTFAFDLNKLLVPTPPIRDENGNIIKGKDDNISVPAGIFGSFTDAPGGLSEELQEISISPGLEYWYDNKFALRVGYFYENPNNGNEQYFTLGFGLKYQDLNFDFSYISASQQNSPLANTLRFSIGYSFGTSK